MITYDVSLLILGQNGLRKETETKIIQAEDTISAIAEAADIWKAQGVATEEDTDTMAITAFENPYAEAKPEPSREERNYQAATEAAEQYWPPGHQGTLGKYTEYVRRMLAAHEAAGHTMHITSYAKALADHEALIKTYGAETPYAEVQRQEHTRWAATQQRGGPKKGGEQ
jgi:hypothetical protein